MDNNNAGRPPLLLPRQPPQTGFIIQQRGPPRPARQPGTQTIFTTTNNTQTGAGTSQPPQICSYRSHAPWMSCGQRIMIFNGTCYSMIGVQCSAK